MKESFNYILKIGFTKFTHKIINILSLLTFLLFSVSALYSSNVFSKELKIPPGTEEFIKIENKHREERRSLRQKFNQKLSLLNEKYGNFLNHFFSGKTQNLQPYPIKDYYMIQKEYQNEYFDVTQRQTLELAAARRKFEAANGMRGSTTQSTPSSQSSRREEVALSFSGEKELQFKKRVENSLQFCHSTTKIIFDSVNKKIRQETGSKIQNLGSITKIISPTKEIEFNLNPKSPPLLNPIPKTALRNNKGATLIDPKLESFVFQNKVFKRCQ